MYVLFIVLNQTNYLDEILTKFVDIGVSGATILDSQGMASAIVNSNNPGIPIFDIFRNVLDDSRPYNKTIFTVLESKELVDKVVMTVEDIIENEECYNAGFMFTIPIGEAYKLGKRK